MKLGVALPIVDIGGEPGAIRDFVQAAEEIGYEGIAAPDHVLGVNIASRPDWTQNPIDDLDLLGEELECTARRGLVYCRIVPVALEKHPCQLERGGGIGARRADATVSARVVTLDTCIASG